MENKPYQCLCGKPISRREWVDNAGYCDDCRELQDMIKEECARTGDGDE